MPSVLLWLLAIALRETVVKAVAVRRLKNHTREGRDVTLRISWPRRVRPSEWACSYHVTGLNASATVGRTVYGLDALQALVLTIDACRAALAEHEKDLAWAGGNRGDCGIPRYIPGMLGKPFARRLARLIDGEFKRRLAAEKRRHRKAMERKIQEETES